MASGWNRVAICPDRPDHPPSPSHAAARHPACVCLMTLPKHAEKPTDMGNGKASVSRRVIEHVAKWDQLNMALSMQEMKATMRDRITAVLIFQY